MQLHNLPIKASFTEQELEELLEQFPGAVCLGKEVRENFSDQFPAHTRYFSNGDKPLVALVVKSGRAIFGHNRGDIMLDPGDMVFFDDSAQHWWTFDNCDLEIFYYRLPIIDEPSTISGDYCLDNYF